MYNYYDFEAEFPLKKAVQKFLVSDYFHDRMGQRGLGQRGRFLVPQRAVRWYRTTGCWSTTEPAASKRSSTTSKTGQGTYTNDCIRRSR